MAIDEKYLDDLLKSITENEEEPRTMDDAMREMALSSEAEDDEIADDGDDSITEEQDIEYDHLAALGDYLEKTVPEVEPAPVEEVDLEEMELLKEIAAAGLSYEQVSLDSDSDEDELDITEMMNHADIGDDALEEINGLLNNVDDETAVDEDILALLENMENNGEGGEVEDPFKLFENEAAENIPIQESTPVQESTPADEPALKEKKVKKKKSKKEKPEKVKKAEKAEKKFRILGKKKRNVAEEELGEVQSDEELIQTESEEIAIDPKEIEIKEIESGSDSYERAETPEDIKTKDMAEKKNVKEKKPGFFSKMIAAFMQDEEDFDDASEENKKLLKEIGDEEQRGKKGKKKKEKGESGAKESKKAAKKKTKKEKPKKQKAPKKPKEKKKAEKTNEKPIKPLGKKTWFVMSAFCATLLASIMLLSVFIPEYADKKAAQKAFYLKDYEMVYTLLYDKKLNADDVLIYNKAKTIRTMERRLESYQSNVVLGRDLEAVDALLKGVACYQILTEADEYGVRVEVDALYMQICSILENDYGITTERAMEINTYDSKAYTRALHDVLYGSTSADSNDAEESEVVEEPASPQDILPEEEEIMD